MRAWLWNLLKRLLFTMDAESVHHIMMRLLRVGIRLGNAPLWISSGASRSVQPEDRVEILGLTFRSRVGLAAGFDKDAEIVEGLPALGFGFAEIGTVTPRPQPGNPRPRLFRDPEKQAIFNRMGFNGLGAEVVSRRLAEALPKLPADFRIGINIGKNKDTSLEDAASDYVRAAKAFEGLADYVVVNVSSPNTPGLRSLQTVEALKPIVTGVNQVISAWKKRPPLLLKLAPEVKGEDLAQVLTSLETLGIDGWILTNTLAGSIQRSGETYSGGWSGGPLVEESRKRLLEARSMTRLPIVSVGGIMTAEEAVERVRAGADLVQLYSGWIYRGPTFPVEVSRALAKK